MTRSLSVAYLKAHLSMVLGHVTILDFGNLKHFTRVPELKAENWLR